MANRKPSLLMYPLMFLAVFITNCGNDPDVIISAEMQEGIVYGFVRPLSIKADMYLILGEDTIAETSTDGMRGNYQFDAVPLGYYTLVAVSHSKYAQSTILVNTPDMIRDDLIMTYGNADIQVSGDIMDTISIKNVYDDNEIVFGFQAGKNTVIDSESFLLLPSKVHGSRHTIIEKGVTETVIRFKTDSIFLDKELQVILKYVKNDNKGAKENDSLVFTCVIDSTGLDSIRTEQLVRQIWVRGNSSSIFRDSKHEIQNMNPESEISIIFNQLMNWRTVEKSIQITPPVPLTFFWSSDTFKIVPSNALLPGSNYMLTIGATAMTADSQFFRCPYNVVITTAVTTFFSDYWPLNGTKNASLVIPFTFESPYHIEPVQFQSAFAISPSVDSIQFVMNEQGRIKVYHTPLKPLTNYQITIDSTFVSRNGTALGKECIISFSTEGN